MRKNKKINLLLILSLILSIFGYTPVYAASATVGFSGNSTVAVGNNITISLYVSNISANDSEGGVTSVGGNLVFDSEYLEYINGSGVYSGYTSNINTGASYKLGGFGTPITGSGQTNLFTFTFKAKKAGTTQISLANAKVSTNIGKFDATINSKSIVITDTQPTPTPTPTPTATPTPTPTATPTATPSSSPKSSDATLKSLEASGYTLSPAFNKDTTNYTVSVPKDATTVKLIGSSTDSKAKITGLGDITLSGDTTTATVKVTAEDGTTKNYTIKIEKEKSGTETKDSDATLKKLDLGGYTLTPTFKKNVNVYSMKVKSNVTALDVTAIPTSDKAKVDVSGNKNWKQGINVVTVKVTAEDGTVNTYMVNVTCGEVKTDTTGGGTTAKSSDNSLKSLVINSSHEISPKFEKNVTSYNVKVPYSVDKLDLSYTTNNSKAKVKVTGNSDFKVGQVNIVEVEVEAEDGSKRTYILNVTRSTNDSDNDLKDLEIEGAKLSPKFDKDTLEYTVTVPKGADKLDIDAIPVAKDAKVEVIGNKNLKSGHNTVLVKVTDKDGFTKYYTIDAVKEGNSNESSKVFGMTPFQFGLLISLFLLLLLLLIFLLRRRKEEEPVVETKIVKETNPTSPPIIEVKPEFNFGSKNSSDDDTVYGDMNQDSNVGVAKLPKKEKVKAIEAQYEEIEDKMPYDPYDETVTKRELIDAIHEASKTKDSTKLKMLLEQDAINQKKKALKKKEALEDSLEDDEEEE